MKLKNKKLTYGFLGFAVVLIATIAYAAAGDRYIYNQNQDKDINIVVNDGGVDTTVLTAEGATSKVKMDTDTLVVDSVNDRVGIKTASPSSDLHLLGSVPEIRVEDTSGTTSAAPRVKFYENGTELGAVGDTASLRSALMLSTNTGKEMMFFTNNQNTSNDTPRMLIDTLGRIGINQASPQGRVHLQQSESNSNDDGLIIDAAGSGSFRMALIGTDMTFHKSGSQFMEVDSTGKLLVNSTTSFTTGAGARIHVRGQPGITINNISAASSPRDTMVFIDTAQDQNGKIECTATSNTCAYVTSSDKRLKKDFRPMRDGLKMVLEMKPSIYKMKDPDDLDKDHTGFVAQELYEVYPEAVAIGGDDELTEPWSIDYGRITPALAAAIQDLAKENQQLKGAIASLEARLNALENN